MNSASQLAWEAECNIVADIMKMHTRPYVNILAGGPTGKATDVGTGTFIEKDDTSVLTCEHVSRLSPDAFFIDGNGSTKVSPGAWRADANPQKDVALASISAQEWSRVSGRTMALPMSRFARKHDPVEMELLFFRGIAGENTFYIGNLGSDAILSGYCSQEKIGSGDTNIFEILWNPKQTTLTVGASEEVKARVKYVNPEGFSGSLVWNTRYVELGRDLSRWCPQEAIVTGLLRRFDPTTSTLLAWRGEHLMEWL